MTTTTAPAPINRTDLQHLESNTRDNTIELIKLQRLVDVELRGAVAAADKAAETRHDTTHAQLNTITLILAVSNVAVLLLLIFVVILQVAGGRL